MLGTTRVSKFPAQADFHVVVVAKSPQGAVFGAIERDQLAADLQLIVVVVVEIGFQCHLLVVGELAPYSCGYRIVEKRPGDGVGQAILVAADFMVVPKQLYIGIEVVVEAAIPTCDGLPQSARLVFTHRIRRMGDFGP